MKQMGQYVQEYKSSQELLQNNNAVSKTHHAIWSGGVSVGWTENLRVEAVPGGETPSNSIIRPWALTEMTANAQSDMEL